MPDHKKEKTEARNRKPLLDSVFERPLLKWRRKETRRTTQQRPPMLYNHHQSMDLYSFFSPDITSSGIE